MANSIEVEFKDEKFSADIFPREGNRRRFSVGSIPLSCTISLAGKPECADLFYSVQSEIRVNIPGQELYTPDEYEKILRDDEMPGHVRFVIAHWMRESEEISNT